MWDCTQHLVFQNLLASHTEAGFYYSLQSQTQYRKASHPVWEKKKGSRDFCALNSKSCCIIGRAKSSEAVEDSVSRNVEHQTFIYTCTYLLKVELQKAGNV